jgi:membrane-bound ClpP family serine protease
MKAGIKKHLIMLVLLLDDLAAIALVFLVLWVLGIEISLPFAVTIGVLLGIFVFIVHKAVIPALSKRKITGKEGIVGLQGEVIEPLAPGGLVKIGDEYWKAKAVEGSIDAGETVEVVKIEGLRLKVRLIKE